MKEEIKKLLANFEEISGEWNGEDSGIKKERAQAAEEGIQTLGTLLSVMEELDIDY